MLAPTESYRTDVHAASELRAELAYRGAVEASMLRMRTRHPFYTWWQVLSGRATLRSGDARWDVTPGHWVLIAPNLERSHEIEPGTELVSLSFTWNWPLGGPVLDAGAVRVAPVAQTPRLCRYAQRAIRRLTVANPSERLMARERVLDAAQWQRFRASLHAFVGELIDAVLALGGRVTSPQTVDARLRHILSDLATRPTAGPLPYERWRPLVGVGRVQIDRLARQHLGMSLHEWRDRQLAREVRRRLLANTTVIKTVAAELGFVDSAHFHRWVKKHLGLIPSEVRGRAV